MNCDKFSSTKKLIKSGLLYFIFSLLFMSLPIVGIFYIYYMVYAIPVLFIITVGTFVYEVSELCNS